MVFVGCKDDVTNDGLLLINFDGKHAPVRTLVRTIFHCAVKCASQGVDLAVDHIRKAKQDRKADPLFGQFTDHFMQGSGMSFWRYAQIAVLADG